MAEQDPMQAIVAELQRINGIMAQNNIRPIVAEVEVALHQPRTADEFIALAKTDIKNLPVFTGEGHPALNSWLTDVAPIIENMDRLLTERYEYHYFLREIKRKIQGAAGERLDNYGVALKWSAIKQALVDHFSDKRSLSVLEIEALTLRQGRNTLEHFHNEANELLTKTLEAIRLSTDISEAMAPSHMKLARDRILACFINGLNAQMEQSCRAMRPKTISEAFNICIEIRNANKLKNMLNNNNNDPRIFNKKQATQQSTFPRQSTNPFQNPSQTSYQKNNSNPFVTQAQNENNTMKFQIQVRGHTAKTT
jgi:hypothetical protein